MSTLGDVIEHETEGHVHHRAEADWKLGEDAHPIRDRVIVQRDASEETYGGTRIVRPAKHRAKSPRCTVIAVGPQCSEVKAGDKVFVNTWSGEPIHHDELNNLFVVLEEDIEAIEE